MKWAKIAAIAAVVAIPVAIGLAVVGTGGPQQSAGVVRPSDLRVSLEVRNGLTMFKRDEPRFTDATQPTIYINLRNDGDTGTAIDRVELVVEDEAELEICDPRGGGETILPWTTGVALDESLQPGDTLTTEDPVAYNVPADDAGRIALPLMPSEALLDAGQRALRLKVRLREVSRKRWLNAGVAVALIGLDGVYPTDFNGKGPLASSADEQGRIYRTCTSANRRRVQQLSRQNGKPAELSEELRSVL